MIDGNTIKFGYGDIVVSSYAELNQLRIIPITHTVEVGTSLCESTWNNVDINVDGNPVIFKFTTCKEIQDLENLLLNINDECDKYVFVYKGYTFDFSKFNYLSIDAILQHLQVIRNRIIFLMAC